MSWDNELVGFASPKGEVLLKKFRTVDEEGNAWEYWLDGRNYGFLEWLDDILDRLERAERKKIR